MDIVLVAAIAENGVIGRGNVLPWRLKSDMAHFRAVTMGKPVVMGRKTYLPIGKPLKGRTTIVVSRDPGFVAPGIVVASGLDAALAAAHGDALRRGADAIVIAGGARFTPRSWNVRRGLRSRTFICGPMATPAFRRSTCGYGRKSHAASMRRVPMTKPRLPLSITCGRRQARGLSAEVSYRNPPWAKSARATFASR